MEIEKAIKQTKPFKSSIEKALVNIHFTASWINSLNGDMLSPYDMSMQQYNILRILRGAGQKMKVQIVKERMVERAPNATRLMDKLCEKDLISRQRCEEDRRVVYVEITKDGLQLLTDIDNAPERLNLVDNLSDEEAVQLSNLLDKIR